MSNYLIVGAGRMAKAVATKLLRSPQTRNIFLDDLNPKATFTLKNQLADDRVKTYLPQDADNIDVCVAACGYQAYVEITKFCIQHHIDMVDLGGNREIVEAQKALNKEAGNVGITVIPDCGLAPGLINILGMHTFQLLKSASCEKIRIQMRVGGLPDNPPGNPFEYQSVWSVDGLINEYITPSEILMHGKVMQAASLDGLEKVTMGPLSTYEAFYTGGGSSNLPKLLEGKAEFVDYKTLRYPGHCRLMKALSHAGFFEGDMRAPVTSHLENYFRMPDDSRDKVIAFVIAEGVNPDGCLMRFGYDLTCKGTWEMTAMAQTTGFSAAIVAEMLADEHFSNTFRAGVVDAEEAVSGIHFIQQLNEAGLKVERSPLSHITLTP